MYENSNLYAAVKQPYIKANETTNINSIKELMLLNGFSNTKNNDYLNKALGIILEYLHEENVLTNNNVLFFVWYSFLFKKGGSFTLKILVNLSSTSMSSKRDGKWRHLNCYYRLVVATPCCLPALHTPQRQEWASALYQQRQRKSKGAAWQSYGRHCWQ